MFTIQDLCKTIVEKNQTIDELKKVIEIAKKVLCEWNGKLCSHCAEMILTDEEEKRLAEKYLRW